MIKFQTVALQLYRKETPTYMFSQESPKRFKNAYFAEHLLMAASETSFKNQVVTLDKLLLLSYLLRSIENNLIYYLHNRVWARNKGHTICG